MALPGMLGLSELTRWLAASANLQRAFGILRSTAGLSTCSVTPGSASGAHFVLACQAGDKRALPRPQ